jgi:UDP-2,3-diacylglucosamine pyrophosphatase LpxH
MTTVSENRHRAIWLSDIHLGTRGCKAAFLLDFLRHNDADHIYLLGDIIDGWRLRKNWYWPRQHNDVVQKILRKARKGARVVYVPGNHDEFLRDYIDQQFGDLQFGGIEVRDETIHTTADGRRLLLLHGDRFDGVVKHAKWLALLGDWAYETALVVNHYYNVLRRRLGYSYWSLSAYLKHRVKNAVSFISNYEQLVAAEARRREVDGVVCGHIHKAELSHIDDILYCNTGDWVESCTAMIEDADGKLRIVHWADEQTVICDERDLNVENGTPPTLPAQPHPALARVCEQIDTASRPNGILKYGSPEATAQTDCEQARA